ncbi:MAG: outer membrane protein assembly factor BamB family protein [Solirubrobacteraceae bacterium]
MRTAVALAVMCLVAGCPALGGLSAEPATATGNRTLAISWLTAGFDPMRTDYNNLETTIGPANAYYIHELWSTDLGGAMVAQPVEAAGVNLRGARTSLIYEGTEQGEFYAIRASNGRIVWQKNLGSITTACPYLPGDVFGIGDAAAISFTSKGRGVVYVLGGDGTLHALDLASGSERPGWPVAGVFDSQEATYGGLNLFNGRLYATVSDHCDQETPYFGSVTEVNVAKHAIAHRFYPAGPPSGGISGGGVWGSEGVSIDPANKDVFTATGNAITTPENYDYSAAVVELTKSLGLISSVSPKLVGTDVDFGSTPVIFKPAGCPSKLVAAENKNGALLVYSEGSKLGARHAQRLQLADVQQQGFKGAPAWDPVTNMLYVANTSNSSHGPFKHGLVALEARTDCHLSLAWQRQVGPQHMGAAVPRTVANGVVYYGDGCGDTEYAFDADSGRKLWQSSGITGTIYAASTIVNGELLVPSWDDELNAFGLGKP